MTFKELGLHEGLLESIGYMGFENATPIQEQSIPTIIEGHDLISCAQTGTGKTAAFLLPILHKIAEGKYTDAPINTLVVVPTRELAMQIDQQLQALSYFTPVSSIAIYGGGDGQGFAEQKKALSKGTDVVIATPGKLISHLNLGYVAVNQLQHLVLDEADRMLDMGFYDDLMKIVRHLPKERQTLMFSATMPSKIRQLAKSILDQPKEINIAISKPAESILQTAYMVYPKQKTPLVCELLSKQKEGQACIIFASTKSSVKEVTAALKNRGVDAKQIHSDLSQDDRETVLNKFKSKSFPVLVATDILSRGIDIDSLDLVINYEVPKDAEDYVHRIGRTARAAKSGVAITLITEDDQYEFGKIEDLIERPVHKSPVPADLGETPEYNPQARRRHNGRKKPFNKKRNHKRPKKN